MIHDDMGLQYHYKIVENGEKEPFYEGLNESLDGVLRGVKAVLTGIPSRNDRVNFKIEININKPLEELIK